MSRGVGTAMTVSELSKDRTKGEQTSTDYTKVGAYLGPIEKVTIGLHRVDTMHQQQECINNRRERKSM